MLKIFFGTLSMILLCIAINADALNEPVSIAIQKIDLKEKTATFPSYDLQVGETGFVLTKLSDYNIISAKLQIMSIENGVAIAKISNFDAMNQKYLPTPRVDPRIGDMAIFHELNNKAFLIAPDATTYEKIKSGLKGVSLMNSDLLMGYLNDYGGFDPKPKFLTKACNVYSVGLLYIVGTNIVNILDCQSLTLLKTIPFDTSKVSKTIAPFFSRLEEVKTGSLASLFYGKKSKDYFKFYDSLVQKGLEFK
ncbi:plasminogen-binding N-terminal domain-containing protein [Helicobacter sp. 11S03491-1]|uniref:plasminogen-binding N-terminal domain-containing protein n=1 Tax=Helicobacter sp. 11S03491-1 TaxID=1476196 RepID=UPI000BA7D515|nr:plasminogen-binding N-terminal domain-containing protein [Helicobacter sp. 11S03491-1]PAF42234.1 hypothetical protein BKH45_04630 [Helicobacter sp. 11S03491-1]